MQFCCCVLPKKKSENDFIVLRDKGPLLADQTTMQPYQPPSSENYQN